MLTAALPMTLPPSHATEALPVRAAEDDDAPLATRAAAGEVAAFEQLYRRHHRHVHGVIVRLVGRAGAHAEDLTQEAFIRAWRALPGFRHDSAIGTWLHRLAVNVALMDLRARRARPWHQDDDDGLATAVSADGASRTQLRMDLARAVATLPPRARAVLVLHDIEGWTHEDIGEELGMAIGSSKAQLHRARRLLRERMGGEP